MPTAYYKSQDKNFTLLQGDCIELLNSFEFKFDMIFADPPYHLSNGGISIQSGVPVSVNKGKWDKSQGFEEDYKFDKTWLAACREHLKSDGTIWVSGTYHNIFSVARCLTELDFKILNCITWVKTNPPPNLSCRYFTYSAEYTLKNGSSNSSFSERSFIFGIHSSLWSWSTCFILYLFWCLHSFCSICVRLSIIVKLCYPFYNTCMTA